PGWGLVESTEGSDGIRTRSVIARDPDLPEGLVDEEGHLHVYRRNELGNLQTIQTEEDTTPRSYVFDSHGRLLASIIPGVRTQLLERDLRGRVVQSHALSFDSRTRLVLRHGYDALDRLRQITDVSDQEARPLAEFHYDELRDPEGGIHQMPGTLLGVRSFDSSGMLDTYDILDRDPKNRLTSQTTLYIDPTGTITKRAHVSYAYRADDQELKVQYGNDDLSLSLSYDSVGNLQDVVAEFSDSKPVPIFTQSQWSASAQLENAQLGHLGLAGVWSNDENHIRNRGRTLCHDKDCTEPWLLKEDYQHYANGFLKNRNDGSAYAYNKRGELTLATHALGSESWDLSAGGQVQTYNGTAWTSAARSPLLPRTQTPSRMEIDGLGRIIRWHAVTATYTADDRLLRTDRDQESTSYGYHAYGSRSYKRFRGSDGQETFTYFPSSQWTIGDLSTISVPLPGDLLAEIDLESRSTTFLLLDKVRTPLKRIDLSGKVLETWQRSAYGHLLQHEGQGSEPTRADATPAFGGHRGDPETTWVDMGFRSYIPELGSFTSPDPLFLTDPEACIREDWQECSLYSYGVNNPVNYFDPLGLAVSKGSSGKSAVSGSSKKAQKISKALKSGSAMKSAKAKPYSNPKIRPKYGKDQVKAVWNAAKQSDGHVYDPNTGEKLSWDASKSRTGQWDMGHKPGHEYRKLHKDYMTGKIHKAEFLRQYRNPGNYQPENPSANRSHKYEDKS
ncbi:MAG: GH-E family nuclease, partial [Pseudobdellovibrionaceae bacterium]|nr:GH-E family nuclease [Pseudobdellovibrionaceae bacterium]